MKKMNWIAVSATVLSSFTAHANSSTPMVKNNYLQASQVPMPDATFENLIKKIEIKTVPQYSGSKPCYGIVKV